MGSILNWIEQMTLLLVFTASLLDTQQLKNSEENKPASLLVNCVVGKDT